VGGGPAGGGAWGRTPSTGSPLQPPPAGGRREACPHCLGPQREEFFLRNRLSMPEWGLNNHSTTRGPLYAQHGVGLVKPALPAPPWRPADQPCQSLVLGINREEKSCLGTGWAHIASASTISGVSASSGRMAMPTRSKSWIIIRRRQQ
jgi:hypothetical protein